MSVSSKAKERGFVVHTIGGGKIEFKASRFEVKKRLNQIHFFDARGKEMKEWVFFLSGIAAVHPEPAAPPQEAEEGSYSTQSY
jgi:hypothetical protein